MLRAYFETKEYNSLESLMASFSLFVRRQKEPATIKARYLNLIKFTRKLLKINQLSLDRRKALLALARDTKALSDKEWVIRKLEASVS
jgi:hypothetical protein